MDDNFEKWLAFLKPGNLKDNLICCSLYIAFFETTKAYVIDQVKNFYSTGFDSETGEIISSDYKNNVLSKASGNVLNASLLWFKDSKAINEDDIAVFSELRKYRNLMAHEMLERLFEGLDKDFAERFSQLIEFRVKIERWWIFEIEIPTGTFDNPEDIKETDVVSSSELMFKMILDIVAGDEEKSNYYYNEFLKYKNAQ